MSIWKPLMPIKYIKNNMKYGIDIDWHHIKKCYNQLNCPKETHNPLRADFTKCGYSIDLSDRSRGKTTNKLLVALIMFREYGIVMHYLRQTKRDCTKMVIGDLYETVLKYGYIEKIFDGEYNDIMYYGKRWYLLKRNMETGEIEDRCEQFCTICFGLDESDTLKSTYNCHTGDIIFHDEFITSHYNYNDFIRFADICKTIIRDRMSSVIYLSANTIDLNSVWFDEFCIRDSIETMEQGDSMYIKSTLGTNIYIEILNEDVSQDRLNVNARFWGFPNPKLSSITGRGTWATEQYQHIPDYCPYYEEDKNPPEVHLNNLYLTMSGKLVKLQLVEDAKRGMCVFVTKATRTYDDSIILTNEDITDDHHVFGMGRWTVFDGIWRLYSENKFYYANNSIGAFVKSYLSYTRTKLNALLIR